MESLDQLYVDLLHRGMTVLMQALDAQDLAWASAEVELLHNVPSLIGEGNAQRHQYFWEQERAAYQAWVDAHGSREAKSRMSVYYAPIWKEMAPIMAELVSAAPR